MKQGSKLTPRARKAAALLLVAAAFGLIGGAGYLAGYPFYTDYRAGQLQQALSADFSTVSTRTAYAAGGIGDGDPLTRIIIASIGLDTMVVEGTSLKALAAGAGHYPSTPLPGEPGNVAIAGHRTMYGKPFGDLDRLKPGDLIILETPFARHTYRTVEGFDGHANPWITHPKDMTILKKTHEPVLTLTTCHPRGSSKQRLIVRAELIGSEPLRGAKA